MFSVFFFEKNRAIRYHSVIIEQDNVDAARTVERARGVSLNIAEREAEQEKKGPFCQRCKRREAFCVTQFPKSKKEIMCW